MPDSYTQNSSNNSFQRYLDNEQKRLAFSFSPFGQFNFGSWFSYPDFSVQSEQATASVNLFSDIDLTPPESAAQNSETNVKNEPALPKPADSQIANYYANKPAQNALQDLLMKTGWLAPNSEANSQLYLAQLQGKLLNKLDLQYLVDQILAQVKLVKEKGKAELTVGLRPKELGEILLILTSRSGMISIQIQAPDEARKLIEDDLLELELALKKAKVNLAEIKIIDPKEVSKHV
ncbi:MAG: flagellar hook-length control protein FliK [Candidatus Margulisiibacteriota bacterium]